MFTIKGWNKRSKINNKSRTNGTEIELEKIYKHQGEKKGLPNSEIYEPVE